MAEKVTEMVLEVDLQCQRCYKKVKKLLCKFPQIRDQAYDEKKNVVKIKVFCCNPEKIRDKLCCMGGGSIKSIEIIKKPDPKPESKPDGNPPAGGKPPKKNDGSKNGSKNGSKPVADPKPDEPKPRGVCCEQCYTGRAGGPCYYEHRRPPPPPPPPPAGCDGYGYGYDYGYGYGYGYGYDYRWNRGYSVSRCGECFSDENPAACVIM